MHIQKFIISELTIQLEGAPVGFGRPGWLECIVIRVADDGAGLNSEKILRKAKERGLVAEDEELSRQQVNDLIFMPGFSTADVVSDVAAFF